MLPLCGLSVLSVTLVHPLKAVGQKEIPFGKNTRVVSSNIVLVREPSPSQFIVILPIAKQLPLLFYSVNIIIKVVETVVSQNRLPIFENRYRYRCDVIVRDHPTDLGLCYSDVTGQLVQNRSFKCRPM